MAPPYKRQHYLPVGYLKYFSADQSSCTRDSWIWRFDGREQKLVPAHSQCSSDYHYSKSNPEAAEANFHRIEETYCGCVDKLRAGREPNDVETGALLLGMVDFFVRNTVHKNITEKEEIEMYYVRRRIFWHEMFLNRTAEPNKEDVQQYISRYWGLWVLPPPGDWQFITSDHPSVWTCLNEERPAIDLITMPLTPKHMAVAFDKRIAAITTAEMTEEDLFTLVEAQVSNAFRALYSSFQFVPEQCEIFHRYFCAREMPTGESDQSTWRLRIAGLSPKHRFSFLRLAPPLL